MMKPIPVCRSEERPGYWFEPGLHQRAQHCVVLESEHKSLVDENCKLRALLDQANNATRVAIERLEAFLVLE